MQIDKIRMKEEIENSYGSILADYAVVKPMAGSREADELNEEDNRGSFQRDRDRIIHTKAFRRLMYKTQVFVNHESDHFRTRLTHTLEVSQFARGICKSLALNEDLAEAIAYGHDLGHTPFGHAVESYFDKVLEERGLGRFYHNEQSVRVVDYLEKRSADEKGLNLTYEVREGILKHNSDRSGLYQNLKPFEVCSTLEGQIVAMVDTIAYICHDLEDGIKAGIVKDAMYKNPDIGKDFIHLQELVQERTGILLDVDYYSEPFFVRKLIHYFIQQITQESWQRLQDRSIRTRDDVKIAAASGEMLIGFESETEQFFKIFKKYIYKNIYGTRTIKLMDRKAIELAQMLFDRYEKEPELLPTEWYYAYNHITADSSYNGAQSSQIRVIIDYISNMTDRYALEENEKLFNPSVKI